MEQGIRSYSGCTNRHELVLMCSWPKLKAPQFIWISRRKLGCSSFPRMGRLSGLRTKKKSELGKSMKRRMREEERRTGIFVTAAPSSSHRKLMALFKSFPNFFFSEINIQDVLFYFTFSEFGTRRKIGNLTEKKRNPTRKLASLVVPKSGNYLNGK